MDEDLELDADNHSSMGGMAPTIRKNISLNLKKSKLKGKSSAKSSKSKKDKKDRDSGDDDYKSSRRTKSSMYDKKKDSESDERDEELDWSHNIAFIGEKYESPMIHICETCLLPILFYGRVSPCKHVFCFTCADKANSSSKQCPRCEDRIERVERVVIGSIFVCTFGGSRNDVSGCRRSYLSQRDLIAHVKHRHERDGSSLADADILKQPPSSCIPLIAPPQGIQMVAAGLGIPQAAGQAAPGASNQVIIANLPPGARQAIFANRLPLQAAQFSGTTQAGQYAAIQAQGIQLAQQSLQGTQFLAHSQAAHYQALPGRISVSNSQASGQGQLAGALSSGQASLQQAGLRMQGQRSADLNWRSGPPISSAQDWTSLQGRTSSYPPSYYKQ